MKRKGTGEWGDSAAGWEMHGLEAETQGRDQQTPGHRPKWPPPVSVTFYKWTPTPLYSRVASGDFHTMTAGLTVVTETVWSTKLKCVPSGPLQTWTDP